jgi:hypothetical protein
MTDLMKAGIREKIWQKMQADFRCFAPHVESDLLMCPACGRLLPFSDFDLEHLIPQQAVKNDPANVRANPETPVNIRSGNILLCKKALILNGKLVNGKGCNSWKGRFYDRPISTMLNGDWRIGGKAGGGVITAALALAYLAMVGHYGYRITLIESGSLMRRQFFRPNRILHDMPVSSQLVLSGTFEEPPPLDATLWRSPFSFKIEKDSCIVVARSFSIRAPLSRPPDRPIASKSLITPQKYKLRPDFTTYFS